MIRFIAGAALGAIVLASAVPVASPDPAEALLGLAVLPLDRRTEDRSPIDDPGVPADDAPIERLERYWYNSMHRDDHRPSAATLARLLDECTKRPGRLDELMRILPGTPENVARVEQIYRAERRIPPGARPDAGEGPGSWGDAVRAWLEGKSPAFLDDLEARARGLVGNEYGVEKQEVLGQLAAMSWERARPVLAAHARSPSPTLSALALGLQFRHAARLEARERETVRARLLDIANRKPQRVPNGVSTRLVGVPERAMAIRALLTSDWPGRDTWYLGLFDDPLILDAESSTGTCVPSGPDPISGLKIEAPCSTCVDALMGPLFSNPDRWVPLVAARLARPGTARDTAAWCLVTLAEHTGRADALRALRPWIEDPRWITSLRHTRGDLFQALRKHTVPELVEPLLRSAARPFDPGDCGATPALGVLVAWRSPGALPFVVEQLERMPDAAVRELASAWCELARPDAAALLAVLVAGTGGPDAPGLRRRASERLASEIDSSFSEKSNDRSWGARWYTSIPPAPHREAVAARLVALFREPGPVPPATLARLRALALRWPCPALDAFWIAECAAGHADHAVLLRLIQRRFSLRAARPAALVELTRAHGWRRGLAAALLADPDAGAGLARADAEAQRTFLAVRRLAREPLTPAELRAVAARADPGVRAALAALARDTMGAPLAELIAAPPSGWRLFGHRPAKGWEQSAADAAIARMRGADAPEELFVLATRSRAWNRATREPAHAIQVTRIGVRGDRATLELEGGRPCRRELTVAELAALRRFVASNGVDGLPDPGDSRYAGGEDHLYLHLSGGAVFALFIHYEALSGCGTPLNRHHDVYDWIRDRFGTLDAAPGRICADVTRTDASSRPIGTLLQLPDSDDFLAGLYQSSLRAVWKQGADLRVLVEDRGARRIAWRAVAGGALAEEREQPAGCPFIGYAGWSQTERPLPGDNRWFVRLALSLNDPAAETWNGLWRERPGADPVRVLPERDLRPVVSPDGRWAATTWYANRTESIRIHDLEHGTGRDVLVPGSEWCSLHGPTPDGRFLARRGSGEHRWWAIDPATARVSPATGELTPYERGRWRPFQPARRPGHVWVGLPDGRIGLYDPNAFRFTETNRFTGIAPNSMTMWVDEDEDHVYALHGNELIRAPLHRAQSR